MKVLLILTILALVSTVYFVRNMKEDTIAKMKDASVEVFANGGFGSGVIVKGKVVTAYHVVTTNPVVYITYGGMACPCDVTYTDPDNDIAVLTPKVKLPDYTWKRHELKVGQKVVCFNNTYGMIDVFLRGYMVKDDFQTPLSMSKSKVVSLGANSGSSGSGVFHKGRLVGIVSGVIGCTGMNIIVPIRLVP